MFVCSVTDFSRHIVVHYSDLFVTCLNASISFMIGYIGV